jgi:hypothetical protein
MEYFFITKHKVIFIKYLYKINLNADVYQFIFLKIIDVYKKKIKLY